MSYNSRLQPSSFQISGSVVTQSYDYFADGRINIVHNNSDQNFDRAYIYDHVGRLSEAKSGGLVNGYQYAPVPYYETFGYSDVMGRQWKTEVLNSNGTVYSTTTNSYNARDQVTNVRQTDNASGVYQDTVMTFDGYGRLASKHVPEQNAGTATVFAYNNDDTMRSVTDARGATASYSFNNRHLVTSISYSAPAGITSAASASFGYDAIGNRTSMTDGTGSATYVFDQLSRLTSESRTFTGSGAPSGTFTLSYQYNLTGQLKKITDPANVTINYNYDNTGRVIGVTGENILVENVSSYVSNVQYRAWGAVKDIDYGNGTHSHLDYNSRLLPTSLALSNAGLPPNYQPTTLTWTYDYFEDGRNHHAYDLTDSRFDRAQDYDHLGRLKETYSGREAIGLSATTPYPDSPYRQTMQYDVWGNMTAKSGRFWRQNMSDSFAHTNNRGPSWRWQYDAEGNMVNGDAKLHIYDAANQQTQFINWSMTVGGGETGHDPAPAIELAQTYDGDGQPAKRTETRRTEELTAGGPMTYITETATTTFYLNSSVLGGAKIVELDSNGQKGKGYVYLNGQILATQQGYVMWRHPNAGSDSWVETHSARVVTRQEMDPEGAEVGTSDPYLSNLSPNYLDIKGSDPLFIDGGDPFDYSTRGTAYGMPTITSDGFTMSQSKYNQDYGKSPFDRMLIGEDYRSHGGWADRERDFLGLSLNTLPDPQVPQKTPTVGGTKDKDAIQDFEDAFAETVSRLDDYNCANLFGGKEAALKALYAASYTYRDLGRATYDEETNSVKVIGAATDSKSNPQIVYINTSGNFRNSTILYTAPGGARSRVLDFGSRLDKAKFGALLLLHELGHLTGVFKSDIHDDKLNRRYTQQVQDACFPKKK